MNLEETKIEKKRKKKHKRNVSVVIALLLIFLILTTAAFFYLYTLYSGEKKEVIKVSAELESSKQEIEQIRQDLKNGGYITIADADEQAKAAAEAMSEDYKQRIRGYMENGDGTLTMLENIYSDMIVVPDIGVYRFFDVEKDLKQSKLDMSAFEYPEMNDDETEYIGDVSYLAGNTKRGVDVSKFQGDIDWKKVQNDNIDFAYIRLGYRGYGSGKIVLDEKYEDNIAACNEIGMDCGVYFFTEAKNTEEAVEEAEFVIENLEGYSTQLPVVLDVEQSADVNESRTKNITAEERTEIIKAFFDRIEEAGYETMIYGNLKSLMIMTEYNKLEDYRKWFAYYHYPLRFPYEIDIWQYRSTGTVDGITGDADLNIMFENEE
ncbi:MAG: hypothetical protein KBT19_06585 [Lachnospiraceae bacterium]|nr:hypothetical protein [Candidatus Colinaster equi]